jgi:hypothetical protein
MLNRGVKDVAILQGSTMLLPIRAANEKEMQVCEVYDV